MASIPVISSAVKERVHVAAIDFGTTYSGYAFSFRSDFLDDPLNISANHWTAGSGRSVSLKTPTCALFNPNKEFHSFGFEAEDKYAELALEERHFDWFYFKRFKMLLYDNKDLNRVLMLKDDKGQSMSAMLVFSECIRYLKDHLISSLHGRKCDVKPGEIHWVLTVPAIWDDSAKQFMREAAINAGINTDNLSLALEPEAASLFCKFLPVSKVEGAHGGRITCFSPGTRYLVLDAGGGTIDITVHETQPDSTVRELYKANGGPWGGTKIDEAFFSFLSDITGQDTMEVFHKDHKDDYLDLFREFEIKKGTLSPDLDQRVTFNLPLAIHETFGKINGQDFRRSLMMKHDLKDQITFAGYKLRVNPEHIKGLFADTCDNIVSHLNGIFAESAVNGTDTILMVGGFSESKILQDAIRKSFPTKTVIIPADAGLAVLKGAVIFGHNPKAIAARVSKFTYGIKLYRRFQEGIHPESKKVIHDGVEKCRGCFDKHVEIGQAVEVGLPLGECTYHPSTKTATGISLKVYASSKKDPSYIDDEGCSYVGKLVVDMADIISHSERNISVKMIYGDTELGVEATIAKTGKVLTANFDFLG